MTDIITDTYNLEITIIEHANLQIKNVVCPDSIEANEDFVISYDIENLGATDDCYGRVIDTNSNAEIVNSRWDEEIGDGLTVSKMTTIPGSDVVIQLTIEVGYVKA